MTEDNKIEVAQIPFKLTMDEIKAFCRYMINTGARYYMGCTGEEITAEITENIENKNIKYVYYGEKNNQRIEASMQTDAHTIKAAFKIGGKEKIFWEHTTALKLEIDGKINDIDAANHNWQVLLINLMEVPIARMIQWKEQNDGWKVDVSI